MLNRDNKRQSQRHSGEEFRDDLRRQGLAVDVVRRLSVLHPVKASLAILHTCGVVVVCLAAALLWWTPWIVIPAMVVIASRQQALFVLAHEAAHYRMFNTRWLNDLIGRACGVGVGVSMCTYRVVHRLHHNHLYEAQDPDIPLHGGYPRGRVYLLKKLARDLLGFTAWKTYAYFFGAPIINDDVQQSNRPLNDTSSRLKQAARQDRWLVAGCHAVAPVAAFAGGYGLEYLLLWVLPLLISGAATSPTMIDVETDELWTSVVANTPIIRPTNGFSVAAKNESRRSRPSSLKPSPRPLTPVRKRKRRKTTINPVSRRRLRSAAASDCIMPTRGGSSAAVMRLFDGKLILSTSQARTCALAQKPISFLPSEREANPWLQRVVPQRRRQGSGGPTSGACRSAAWRRGYFRGRVDSPVSSQR